MTRFLPLLLANVTRKKARLALTVGSYAVALFLFGLLSAVDSAFSQGVEVAGADRLIVRNRVSLIMPLPFSYRDRMLAIPGVRTVTFATWFGGIYQEERNFFPNFAVDPDHYLETYPEFRVDAGQWSDFLKDRQACAAGRKLAERFGWKVGDRIPLKGTLWPGVWEFNLRAIYRGSRPEDDESQFWFRYDYLEERRPWGKGTVGWYVVRVADPDRAAGVARAIDDRFANSSFETAAETEKAFAAGFVRQMGNIQALILAIGSVVFFTLLLVTGNVMAIAVRERLPEIGVLKTLGFSDGTVLGLLLAESCLYAAAGGTLGLLAAKAFTLAGDPTGGLLAAFYVSWARLGAGFLLALAVGLGAGLLPGLFAMRLKIVDSLRRV
ncbi:MAG: ABC transporter permease [Acidobacteriota bacterium]